jgi:hypothetical protein
MHSVRVSSFTVTQPKENKTRHAKNVFHATEYRPRLDHDHDHLQQCNAMQKQQKESILSSGELNPGLPRVACDGDKRKY